MTRLVDGIGARVCSAQVVHILASPVDGGGHAQGREGTSRVGMGYW